MFGAINKVFRKVAAFKGTNEFETRLIKATFGGDLKEAKEKHLLFILEVLKGRYLSLIKPKDALEQIFDTLFSNIKSVAVITKCLSILHRALQEDMISQMVAVKIKQKENMLINCVKDVEAEHSQDLRMQITVSDLYIDYVKSLTNFLCMSSLFNVDLKDLVAYSKNLQITELFTILHHID
jgi:hypothetical protein